MLPDTNPEESRMSQTLSPAIYDLLALVESKRRDELYETMAVLEEITLRELLRTLSAETEKEMWRIRSRLTYERHMAAYQQDSIEESLTLAEQSSREAKFGDDEVGALFAEMNISGLLLPALGKWEYALGMSGGVCAKAEAIAYSPLASERDRNRASRIAMNTYFHRIRMTIQYRKDFTAKHDVQDWLDCVRENPVYLSIQHEFRTDVEAAEKFIQR